MRLIDADELRKKFYGYTTESGVQVALDHYAVSCIDNAPTVDAVQIVRCKDCKRWDDIPISDEKSDHECHLFDGNEENLRIATPSNWFCPMGERRSEPAEGGTDDVPKTD